MINQYHAQRQHIISSLDTLLYQLLTLSFFFAPSLLSFFCRVIAQTTKPRDDDISHSLRFYLVLVVLLNFPSLWYHTMRSSADDRAIVLDFVGLAYVPSKLQLITLDATIIILQIILITIAYETSLSVNSPEQDILTPLPPLELPSHSASSSRMETKNTYSPQYIVDLRFKSFLYRLRHPPTIRPTNANSVASFPNTSTWSFPSGMGVALLRAGRRARAGASNRPSARERRGSGDQSEA